jgi:hypothetical protein
MRVLTALAAIALPVLACECRHLSVCELIQMPTVFIGEVIDGGVASIRDDPWYSNVNHVRFRVLESLRGLPANAQTVDVELTPTAGMCAPIPYFPGRKYLVVPGKRDGKYTDGGCFQGRDIETAQDEVRQVREYFAGNMKVNVNGRVAVSRASDLVDFLLDIGESKPLAGIVITATRNGKSFSTVTDSEGRYHLPVPSAGVYRVSPESKTYALNPNPAYERPLQISVPPRGCAIRNFGLMVDNTISGSVRDEKGEPISEGRVGLIDLDRPAKPDHNAWFAEAYIDNYKKGDTTFTFENVPIGRYLLVFNPDGPHSGTLIGDLPYEITYYPLNAQRAEAKRIDVTSGGTHLTGMDLTIGKKVEFREVSVHVQFPDGSPMKTAEVECTAWPNEQDGFPLNFHQVALETNGTVHFSVPANRKLKIEIKDWYGRDLKKPYTSTHEADSSPITQEFVVVP